MAAVKKWDLEVDVVVVGSGGAALTAAIVAHDQGARVAVVERSDKVGGTTAVSGGGLWIPLNHHMSEVGMTDSREEALAYCKRLTAGAAPDELVETFVDTGHQMVRYLEDRTPVKFIAHSMPDYQPELEGGKRGGRSLEPAFFAKSELGPWESKLRGSPLMFTPLTTEEAFKAMAKPLEAPVEAIMERMEKGLVGSGNGLMGPLLKGCVERGITILLETRGRELVRDGAGVIGLRAEREGGDYFLGARGGVILACGGFEWSQRLRNQFLTGPIDHMCSPAHNEGDGLIMAMEVGADLANMSQAWLYPGTLVPGEEHDGHPVSHWAIAERTMPHTILVNRFGQRFANEGANYNDMSKAFYSFDATTCSLRNLPCWAIFDRQYREKYMAVSVMPPDPDPDWLVRDHDLESLARRVGIDPEGLKATLQRWNGLVAEGKDRDFDRGQSAYERWVGDPSAPHPNLGSIEKPPFYAVPIYVDTAGTKGGPRTNAKGQVLNVRGNVIPGLYAAGNAMAGISGPGYYGGGGTIGLGMTWGYICAIDAAKAAKGAPEAVRA